MDTATLLAGVAAIAAAINSGLVIWNFLQSPSSKNAKAIAGLDGRLGKLEQEVSRLDTIIEQLPDKDSFHALDKGLTEVRGKIDSITQTLQSAGHSLSRIESFLIDQAKQRKEP